jgi:hypothetical protein
LSIFAANTKSLSVKPLILCVQVVISTFPQASKMSGWCPCLSKLAHAIYEFESSAKIRKREGLRDVMFFDDVPPIDLLLKSGEFLTL